MRPLTTIFTILILTQFALFGCALGKKEWPAARESEDTFKLELLAADVQNDCLLIEVAVIGAADKLYRASIQHESVGDEGGGCIGCPFVPRDAKHFTRNQKEFVLSGNKLSLSLCGLESDKEYRFRVAGKSELPTSPIVYTDVYVTTP